MAMLDYSVVIPVYNSTGSLANLATRLDAVFKKLQRTYEIILIDDGSPNPATWPAIEALCRENPQVKAMQHRRNFGQHAAFFCGLRHALGQWIVTMDDDGEHRPEDLPALIAQAAHDVVMAKPPARVKSLADRLTSRLKMWFENKTFGMRNPVYVTSFCLFSQEVSQAMLQVRTPYPLLSAAQFYVTRDIVNVPVEASVRMESVSGYTFFKRMRLFGALVINHSSLLLRLLGMVGIGTAMLSFLAAVFILLLKFTSDMQLGWPSLMVSLCFFNGLILFGLGIIGEYLLRIVAAAERKPTSIVRRTIGMDA